MKKLKNRSGSPVAERPPPTVGERIIEGLSEALAWSKGEGVDAMATSCSQWLLSITLFPSRTPCKSRIVNSKA